MYGFSAQRLAKLQQSEIRNMTCACERIGGINLGQGLGDLPTPALVREGAIEAIEAGKAAYTLSEGILGLREAIAAKLSRDNGMQADPATDIVVTSGATGAFTAALMGLLKPGDGVLLLEPYYGYHLNSILLAGTEPQFLTLAPPDFALEEAELRAAIRPHTKATAVALWSRPKSQLSRLRLSTKARSASACCVSALPKKTPCSTRPWGGSRAFVPPPAESRDIFTPEHRCQA